MLFFLFTGGARLRRLFRRVPSSDVSEARHRLPRVQVPLLLLRRRLLLLRNDALLQRLPRRLPTSRKRPETRTSAVSGRSEICPACRGRMSSSRQPSSDWRRVRFGLWHLPECAHLLTKKTKNYFFWCLNYILLILLV